MRDRERKYGEKVERRQRKRSENCRDKVAIKINRKWRDKIEGDREKVKKECRVRKWRQEEE